MSRTTDPEISLIGRMCRQLAAFDAEAQRRIVSFVASKVQGGIAPPAPKEAPPPGPLLSAMEGPRDEVPT